MTQQWWRRQSWWWWWWWFCWWWWWWWWWWILMIICKVDKQCLSRFSVCSIVNVYRQTVLFTFRPSLCSKGVVRPYLSQFNQSHFIQWECYCNRPFSLQLVHHALHTINHRLWLRFWWQNKMHTNGSCLAIQTLYWHQHHAKHWK